MKTKLQFIVSASAVSVLAFSALGQTPAHSETERTNYARHRMAHPYSASLNAAAKASDLIGMPVKNYQDEKLGKVEDLAVDVESGRIVHVVVSTGGIVGIRDTLTPVPPGALHHDVAQKVVHLDANKEKLKNAPKFETSNWGSDSNQLSEVYRHYGQERAFVFVHGGPAVLESQYMLPVSRLSHVQKASKLMGTAVKNLQDQKLGKVENLMVDLSAGRVVAVVISSGGFLGMGDELSAVPPSALRFTTDRETLQLDASKETMSNAPRFKANQWPDFGQPTYVGSVYRAYKVEPYFSTEPDNTARNVRDRDNRSLTPLDQGNNAADVQTTAQIRKEITAADTLSVNAKNVKIITVNGRVTLRGPVNSEEEKRMLGEIAARVTHSGNVDNQLEVKSATTK